MIKHTKFKTDQTGHIIAQFDGDTANYVVYDLSPTYRGDSEYYELYDNIQNGTVKEGTVYIDGPYIWLEEIL